jgi:hypothetical protein
MLLPIGNDNTQFGGVVLNRMLPTIHRAAVEDNYIGCFPLMMPGHRKRISDLTIGRNRVSQRRAWWDTSGAVTANPRDLG